MNLRNRYAVISIRTLLGLFFVMSGVGGLMALSSGSFQGVPEPMIAMTKMLAETGIFHMIKFTEIIAGLMLVAGFLPQLAAIFLAPVCIGILVFNSRVSPENLPAGILVTALTVYLGYAYWDKYKGLFERK